MESNLKGKKMLLEELILSLNIGVGRFRILGGGGGGGGGQGGGGGGGGGVKFPAGT